MPSRVRLLECDPDLAAGIPAADIALARRLVVVDSVRLAPGAWDPTPVERRTPGCFALLVLEGVLVRELQIADRPSSQLLGPGELVRLRPGEGAALPSRVSWEAMQPSVVAMLDERFARAERRWPAVGAAVERRLLAQADRLAEHVAIAHLGRVELRLLALLWHLAERFGRVTSDGVVLPLPLTHETLGRLVGAQRPTVSLALAPLAEAGAVTRRPDGSWHLSRASQAMLGLSASVVTLRRRRNGGTDGAASNDSPAGALLDLQPLAR